MTKTIMATIKSLLKERNEMLEKMAKDIHEMTLNSRAFMKALTTDGAAFPVIIVANDICGEEPVHDIISGKTYVHTKKSKK